MYTKRNLQRKKLSSVRIYNERRMVVIDVNSTHTLGYKMHSKKSLEKPNTNKTQKNEWTQFMKPEDVIICGGRTFLDESISMSRILWWKNRQEKYTLFSYPNFPWQNARREKKKNRLLSVSNEHITRHHSWRAIIISFINAIVRNYNFLFGFVEK